jgi:hypothetical protein
MAYILHRRRKTGRLIEFDDGEEKDIGIHGQSVLRPFVLLLVPVPVARS